MRRGSLRVLPRLLRKYARKDLPLVLPVKQVGFLSEPDFKPLSWGRIQRKGCHPYPSKMSARPTWAASYPVPFAHDRGVDMPPDDEPCDHDLEH